MDTELICKLIDYLNSLPDGTQTTTMEAAMAVIGKMPENMVLITLDAELRKEASRNKLVLEPVHKKPIYTGQPFKEPYIVQHKIPGSRLQADKWDYLVSAASGTLTATMDILWTEDLSFENAHSWGADKVEDFVEAVAKNRGCKTDGLTASIEFLEEQYPIDADKLANKFGSGYYHHLRDFSHHPTPMGLLFAIFSQVSGKFCGTNTDGKFITETIPGWKRPDLVTGLYQGTVVWALHMVSDMAGSSSSARQNKEGTGLPGPLMSFFKELSSVPGVRALAGKDEKGHYKFSQTCSKLFNGTLTGEHDENGKLIKGGPKFDLRTELGLAHESITSKQYIPVLINETIVCAFYSVSRLVRQLKIQPINDVQDLKSLDFSTFLPWRSPALQHMRTLAASTFSVIEITTAGIQAYVSNKGNKAAAVTDCIQKINYIGIIRLTAAMSSETCSALGHLYDRFELLAEQQKAKLITANPNAVERIGIVKKAAVAAGAIGKIGTPVGFVSAAIGVYDELAQASKELKIAYEDRVRIESECRIQIQTIQENRQYMEEAVEQYMQERLEVFSKGLSDMDQAWAAGDTDLFLSGNAAIQKKLGNQHSFSTQTEFDDMMNTELTIKF